MPLTLAFTIAPRFGSATPRSAISKSRASSISSSRTSLFASAVEPVLWELAEIEVHEGVSGVGCRRDQDIGAERVLRMLRGVQDVKTFAHGVGGGSGVVIEVGRRLSGGLLGAGQDWLA
jgi:hypothetical protein